MTRPSRSAASVHKMLRVAAAADREADAKRGLDDYFRTQTSFEELYAGWSASDERFAAVKPAVRGVRILRQDPFECLISFICKASNNNIAASRSC